jgi:DNA-binding MarR family transcriptional regulator
MSPSELDRAAYLILRALCTLGFTDINGLAAVLGLDSSTVGRQIAGVAGENLVSRSPADEDRRRAVIVSSEEGANGLTSVEPEPVSGLARRA